MRTFPSFLWIASVYAYLFLVHVRAGVAAPVVTYQSGQVTGSTRSGIDTFKGIPYAVPPTGENRLKAPEPVTESPNNVDGTRRPRSCPQFLFDTSSFPQGILGRLLNLPLFQIINHAGEDCLNLNVQRPATATAGSNLPVLVWIYGGGFAFGSTESYDGSKLIQESIDMGEPIIFVQMNYRLGGFGFLPGEEAMEAGVSNLGLLDQRLALQWVSDNIAKFGGNPDKVTIWGESAGASFVFNHLIMNDGNHTYDGKELFHGAIMNSGSMIPSLSADSAKARGLYRKIIEAAGCDNSQDSFGCLKGLSYTKLLNAFNSLHSLLGYNNDLAYRPRPDGRSITDSAEVLIDNGMFAHVPVVVGDQEDEGTLGSLSQRSVKTTEDVLEYLRTISFANATLDVLQQLVRLYPDDPAQGCPFRTGKSNNIYPQYKRMAAINGDTHQTMLRRAFLDKLGSIVPAWAFMSTFSHDVPILGTYHGSDLPYAFGRSSGNPQKTFQRYYVSFVNHQDPTSGNTGLGSWPPWVEERKYLEIGQDENSLKIDSFRNQQYQFIASNLGMLRT